MQSPYPYLHKGFITSSPSHQLLHLGFHRSLYISTPHILFTVLGGRAGSRRLVTLNLKDNRNNNSNRSKVTLKGNKENVWSVDNEMAKKEKEKERGKPRRRTRGKRVARGRKGKVGRVLVSGAMLMEIENVLQTQEPVIKPAWTTFASSVSGIWKGLGAVFSPITGEMEPIDMGRKNENLYDCYTLSRVEALPPAPGGTTSQIRRRINWVTLNPYGEILQRTGYEHQVATLPSASDYITDTTLPKFESFNMEASDVMEEDLMGCEPGLVYFEDGSYSRGPVNIPVGEADESNYFLSSTFKFEQCLVKGCHKRLRLVHTIEFNNEASEIQIMRVAVYEEHWVSPANLSDPSGMECELKPFSERKRTQPSELTGPWKVFEVSATPICGEDSITVEGNETPLVYLCTETLKKRSLPESSVSFGEEELVDMQDVTMLWLPGGVTAYVDVDSEGILCIGVGWYSDEGINLVMERDYGTDGTLKEVRWKSEVKRRWPDPFPM